jgi:hypothetical protein
MAMFGANVGYLYIHCIDNNGVNCAGQKQQDRSSQVGTVPPFPKNSLLVGGGTPKTTEFGSAEAQSRLVCIYGLQARELH